VYNPPAGRELSLGGSHVAQRFKLVEEGLVLRHPEENGSAAASLGEDDGASPASNPPHDGRRVRPELGERTDLCRGTGLGQDRRLLAGGRL